MSVRAADQRKWIILSLNPGSSELLTLWVRTFRGPLPGDNNPTSAYVFGTDNGNRCTSIHKYTERFAKTNYFIHYTLATVQAVWRGAARLSGEQDVKDAVEEGLVQSPFESVDGEDRPMLAGTRGAGARPGKMELRASQVRQSMNQLLGRDLARVGWSLESMKIDSQATCTAQKTFKQVARPHCHETPSGLKRRLEDEGHQVTLSQAKNLKNQLKRDSQASFIKVWLLEQVVPPTRYAIRQFVEDHKLYLWKGKASAGAIQGWWQSPATPKRTRSEHAEEQSVIVQDKLAAVPRCIQSKCWPGLAVNPDLPGRGRGIIATTPFVKGYIVCHYNGEVLKPKRAGEYVKERVGSGEDTSYLLAFDFRGERYCIDGKEEDGSQGRLINHSRPHPNLKKCPRIINGQLFLLYEVIRGVESGDELLYDYYNLGSIPKDTPNWLKASYCPCPRCKPS